MQRWPNEQSNVAAVGPTLRQRLAYGWLTVTVLVLDDISMQEPSSALKFSFIFDFPCVSAVFPRGNASSLILIYCVNAVPGARTQTTLPLSPPPTTQSNGGAQRR